MEQQANKPTLLAYDTDSMTRSTKMDAAVSGVLDFGFYFESCS